MSLDVFFDLIVYTVSSIHERNIYSSPKRNESSLLTCRLIYIEGKRRRERTTRNLTQRKQPTAMNSEMIPVNKYFR